MPVLDSSTVHLPTAGSGLDQDEEWCELLAPDGSRRRIRFHDYAEVYRVPGLYEYLFATLLACESPRIVSVALEQALAEEGTDPAGVGVLDFGAGNGMVGEQLRGIGVGRLVGVDLLPEAREAALRDRPGVYDDYLAADLTALGPVDRARLEAYEPDAMTCVAALGFGDVPTLAFAEAFNLVRSPGLVAFNLRDRFFDEHDESGFGDLVARLRAAGALEEVSRRRYCHRRSVSGDPLYYLCVVTRKHGDIPLEWVAPPGP